MKSYCSENTNKTEFAFQIPINFSYRLAFTEGVFEGSNSLLADYLTGDSEGLNPVKVLLFLDRGLHDCQPLLYSQILDYFKFFQSSVCLKSPPVLITGGEGAKYEKEVFENILQEIHDAKICRHSYVVAVGGGAVIDAVCFAASVAHRGVRQIRIPTTVLAQADAGIGIKNGINAFHKKNFLGTFSPPDAVINDGRFLLSLDQENWISGIAEAIKVGLIKDVELFLWIRGNATSLRKRDVVIMQELIRRSAELHLRQISQGGDPFEKGSKRPLDFGHWVAHKLESISNYRISHGHAVAIGIAVDSIYSYKKGFLPRQQLTLIITCLEEVGFNLREPQLLEKNELNNRWIILDGIDEFREHLGGVLTVSLLEEIGKSFEIHEIEEVVMMEAITDLMDNSFDSGRITKNLAAPAQL
ncbi:MAG: 3-dehydroquinate synthase [Bdellovibrionia bacterium]